MTTVLQYVIYCIFRLMVGLFAILPLSYLYKLSDGLSFILQYVIRYRKSVVMENLTACFPEKSKEEINAIQKAFYSHLADIFLEGLKGFTMSDTELKERYKVVDPSILQKAKEDNVSILLAGSHYNNWEWGVLILNQWLDHQVSGIYQIVKNTFIHNYLMKTRSRWGMHLISAKNAIKSIITFEGTHAVMILSDQSPSNMRHAHWVHFLNRDTPCTHGLEVMAKKTNYPIYYMYVTKPRRGYYEVFIDPLITQPGQYEAETITAIYTKRLEETIKKQPQYWLWSHDRWKRATPRHKAMKEAFRR